MAFKLKHQNGSPFHQQQESNRLSDEEFNKQFNEGQIFQGGQDIDLGSTERNVSKGAGFPTGASQETIQKWYNNNPPQGDTISATPEDAFKSDSWLKQGSTLISNPFQGLRALGNQMSYNYVTDEFGTNDTDPAFNNLTNLRAHKKNRKFGTMQGDEMNLAAQAGLFAASGGVKALQGLFKAPAAINAATTAAKSGKALNFVKSLKNPLTTQTYLDAASGDLTALGLKYLPKAFSGKAKDLIGKGYYGYKGSKIGGLKDLVKAGTKGAIDLSKAVANSVTPEVSKTGLVNAYAQMGKGMQEKITKEKALDVAKEETAIAETNNDNLIMRGS